MAAPGTWSGTFAQLVGVVHVSVIADISSAALLSYDTLLTFEREIQLVWGRRWSVPTALYLLTRWGNTLQAILNAWGMVLNTQDLPLAYAWHAALIFSLPMMMLVVEATLAIRVIALYGNGYKIRTGVWTWYLLTSVSTLTMMGITLRGSYAILSPAPPILGDQMSGPMEYWYTIYIPSLVFEATVAMMTLIRAVHYKWFSLNRDESPLVYVFIRDGFFYFFVVFALNLVNLLVTLLAPQPYLAWTPQLSVSIATTIVVRMFLNLRQVAYGEVEASESNGPHATSTSTMMDLESDSRSMNRGWSGIELRALREETTADGAGESAL